ncbi:MAG: hypothetical protein ACM3X6_14160 [Patescibacteria group bacterium]
MGTAVERRRRTRNALMSFGLLALFTLLYLFLLYRSVDLRDAGGAAVDDQGNIYACLTERSFLGDSRISLVKYDSAGKIVWRSLQGIKTESTVDTSIIYEYDKIFTFHHLYFINRQSQQLLIGYNTEGRRLWRHKFEASKHIFLNRYPTKNTLQVINITNANDLTILSIDAATGATLNKRSVSIPLISSASALIALDDGLIYGLSSDLAKTDADGKQEWAVDTKMLIQGILVDEARHVYACGPSIYGKPYIIAKYAWDGSLIWRRELGEVDMTVDRFTLCPGGGVYLAAHESVRSHRASIIKIDEAGGMVWRAGLPLNVRMSGLAVDRRGNAVVIGTMSGQDGRSAFVAKYNPAGKRLWFKQRPPTNPHLLRGLIPLFVAVFIAVRRKGYWLAWFVPMMILAAYQFWLWLNAVP